jgi:lipopolysaccharide/colanic/teichoic acid biosynthesis glycosyltransferase
MSTVPRGFGLKRALDVVGATIALTLLSPFFILIISLVWLDQGHSIFAATRRQYYGREIWVLRFPAEKCREITCRFLIETGAERLPQLLNILSGTLSFIGPDFQTNLLTPPRYVEAFRSSPLTPGLLRPKARSRSDGFGSSQLEADYLYVSSWSFWLDLKVLTSHAFPEEPTFTDRQAW